MRGKEDFCLLLTLLASNSTSHGNLVIPNWGLSRTIPVLNILLYYLHKYL